MNEFTAKKLAEVAAFAKISDDIYARGNPRFVEYAHDIAEALSRIEMPIVNVSAHEEIFTAKVKKTVVKLTDMMELYIGDSWDNPVEVLEWLSFYTGAASAHADLTAAALREIDHTTEAESIEALSQAFWTILGDVKAKLALVGSERATV